MKLGGEMVMVLACMGCPLPASPAYGMQEEQRT